MKLHAYVNPRNDNSSVELDEMMVWSPERIRDYLGKPYMGEGNRPVDIFVRNGQPEHVAFGNFRMEPSPFFVTAASGEILPDKGYAFLKGHGIQKAPGGSFCFDYARPSGSGNLDKLHLDERKELVIGINNSIIKIARKLEIPLLTHIPTELIGQLNGKGTVFREMSSFWFELYEQNPAQLSYAMFV
jgi:hypothetical protein